MKVKVKQGLFDSWIVVNAEDERFAWSGSRWVPHQDGVPIDVQVSNFDNADDAKNYARSFGFEVVK